jgi:ankyrin repeat family A protein 2
LWNLLINSSVYYVFFSFTIQGQQVCSFFFSSSYRAWDLNLSSSKRRSAFLPYKPKPANTVLTNLQRGNTEASIAKDICLSFHEKSGQGEITAADCNEMSVDALDSNKFTPLLWACYYGQLSSVGILMEYGANVNYVGPDYVTPLLLAAAGGHHEIVRILLKKGADINHMDIVIGFKISFLLFRKNYHVLFFLFLQLGNTSLMYSAAGNHPHTCNEILLYQPNITVTNEDGETAYSLAIENNAHLGKFF